MLEQFKIKCISTITETNVGNYFDRSHPNFSLDLTLGLG